MERNNKSELPVASAESLKKFSVLALFAVDEDGMMLLGGQSNALPMEHCSSGVQTAAVCHQQMTNNVELILFYSIKLYLRSGAGVSGGTRQRAVRRAYLGR